MPIYVYKNINTGETFELEQRITEKALSTHPETGDPVKRLIQPVGIAFKGSGFYVTDSRNSTKGKAKSESSESKTETKTEGKSESTSESKSESTSEAKSESKSDSKAETKTETKKETPAKEKPAAKSTGAAT